MSAQRTPQRQRRRSETPDVDRFVTGFELCCREYELPFEPGLVFALTERLETPGHPARRL